MKTVQLNNFEIGKDKLTIFAGPCVIENMDMLRQCAKRLKEICLELDINYIFKASFDKANRSSITSYRGPGLKEGLLMLSKIKEEFEVPIVTDFHESNQASEVAKVADVLQIPAFLCRQTDMLTSAAKTGKIVNIKKGQFLSPYQMESLAKKVLDCDNDKILITERGTSFGYNNLVVDMRSIEIIQDMGYPVVFDATHSVQLPGGRGESSGGERRFVPLLARSAIVSGARALFFEIHPCPDCAKCDGDNMIALDDAYKLFKTLKDLFELSKKII